MIVDFHTHVFPDEILRNRESYVKRDPWFAECYGSPRGRAVDAQALIGSMDRAGIGKSVVCGFCWTDPELCAFHNDYIIEAVRRYPDRLVGLAIVQPAQGAEAVDELCRCLSAGLRGVGELNADAQGFSLDDWALLDPLVRALVDAGAFMLLHTSEPVGHLYPGKGSADPRVVYRFVSRFPDLTLVCAHWGGGLPFYELMPEVAAATRNVFYDTSASTLLYDMNIFRLVAEIVGQHRILFGTDYPLLRQDNFVNRVRGLQLPEPMLNGILGGNALRLLENG